MSSSINFYFTTHYNWRWVTQSALTRIEQQYNEQRNLDQQSEIHCVECSNSRDLPGMKERMKNNNNKKFKVEYALIRLDIVFETGYTLSIRVDSPALSFMDPKDILYRELAAVGAEATMPKTSLIPWYVDDIKTIPDLTVTPAILKAPLGSGGFGLYFVYNKEDIFEVMKHHRQRAELDPKAMKSVEDSFYTAHPLCWSLQELVSPMLCQVPGSASASANNNNNTPRKSQIRAYIVECEGDLYLYNTLEVRLPSWNIDLSQTLAEETEQHQSSSSLSSLSSPSVEHPGQSTQWCDAIENECVGQGHARPYNEQRNKADTQRYLLSEVEELSDPLTVQTLRNTLRTAFTALQPNIRIRAEAYQEEKVRQHRADEVSLAVLGVDLLVHNNTSDGVEAVIVEVNNNPAMAGSTKQMSTLYREHLITFNQAILALAMQSGRKKQRQQQKEEAVAEAGKLDKIIELVDMYFEKL